MDATEPRSTEVTFYRVHFMGKRGPVLVKAIFRKEARGKSPYWLRIEPPVGSPFRGWPDGMTQASMQDWRVAITAEEAWDRYIRELQVVMAEIQVQLEKNNSVLRAAIRRKKRLMAHASK